MHPLIALSVDAEVKQAKGFRAAAAALTGERLDALYREEATHAPRRKESGKRYLGVRTGRTPTGPQAGKDDRHFALALHASTAEAGSGVLEMPDGAKLTIVDSLVPLRTAAPDRALGDGDANKGVEDVDLLALLPDDRVAVVRTKFLDRSATRGAAGDTPLRALLSGLAQAAIVDANREALREEIEQATSRRIGDEAPALILAGTPRYWEVCRKREAQKGAGWIRELERLGREIAAQIGVEVFFVAVDVGADPALRYTDNGPLLAAAPELDVAWEQGAGKLKPKPKSRPKKTEPADVLVEADATRAPRPYSIREQYAAGDTILHPKLGTGVVQGSAGKGKITVLFGDDKRLLVHERA